MRYRLALWLLMPVGIAAGGIASLNVASAAGEQTRQTVTGPVAVYWLSADTVTGFGAASAGAMSFSALMGGNNPNHGAQRMLQLYLGSRNQPSAPPAPNPDANHLPPAILKMGQSLPLLSPEKVQGRTVENSVPDDPGRLLIYWGCVEKARPGQPLIIDYSKPGAKPVDGLAGPGFKGLEPPTAEKWASFGEWPNRKSHKVVPMSGSLVGEHVVKANYAPEIRFTLAATQDFLAPLLPKRSALASGGTMLKWPAIPNARAYFAGVIGNAGKRDTIIWSSSESKMLAMGLPPYIGAAEITRLLNQRLLMGPQQTECAVPAEVIKTVGEGAVLVMNAFGQEADFAFPARPANPATPWHIQWTAKALNKATYMGALADDGGSSDNADNETGKAAEQEAAPPPKRKKRSVLDGLGGILFR